MIGGGEFLRHNVQRLLFSGLFCGVLFLLVLLLIFVVFVVLLVLVLIEIMHHRFWHSARAITHAFTATATTGANRTRPTVVVVVVVVVVTTAVVVDNVHAAIFGHVVLPLLVHVEGLSQHERDGGRRNHRFVLVQPEVLHQVARGPRL